MKVVSGKKQGFLQSERRHFVVLWLWQWMWKCILVLYSSYNETEAIIIFLLILFTPTILWKLFCVSLTLCWAQLYWCRSITLIETDLLDARYLCIFLRKKFVKFWHLPSKYYTFKDWKLLHHYWSKYCIIYYRYYY